jgi:hypothetical protein
MKAAEIENECTHDFQPFDSTGRLACIYCNTPVCRHGVDHRKLRCLECDREVDWRRGLRRGAE